MASLREVRHSLRMSFSTELRLPVIKNSNIFRHLIGSDSGPLHVASLVGTPVVQILGPTDPVQNAPYPETPSRTVHVPLGCSPCRRGCRAVTCMRIVPPAAILAAAAELLAPNTEAARSAAGAVG